VTKQLFVLVIAFCVVTSCVITATAQSRSVKFRFEVDGLPMKGRPKIILYGGDERVETPISGNGFVLPSPFEKYAKVNVRFILGSYKLFFESVYLSKFEGEWVIGVDSKRFDKDNTASAQPGRQIKEIHYITFYPLQGDGTRIVVISYKK
jgi:hypothetical protein